jgi:lysyl-tRNA synthetase class I
MGTQKIAGASELDKSAHRVHGFATDKRSEGWWNTHVICPRCGHELETSYCEERLYMVRCGRCETVTLTTGESPGDAAEKLGIGRGK